MAPRAVREIFESLAAKGEDDIFSGDEEVKIENDEEEVKVESGDEDEDRVLVRQDTETAFINPQRQVFMSVMQIYREVISDLMTEKTRTLKIH